MVVEVIDETLGVLCSSTAFFQVKLVSIDAAEIADGNPSLVLGLIWNIILFFQVNLLLSGTWLSR